MNSKEYNLPNGKKAVFEYDINGVGKITLECMDELMAMIADRPQGEWVLQDNKHHIEKTYLCSNCKNFQAWGESEKYNFCPNCGARMRPKLQGKHFDSIIIDESWKGADGE